MTQLLDFIRQLPHERYTFLIVNLESHIGQYKIVRILGSGGMGTVYLGEHLLLGRLAAIKTLLPGLSIHKEIVDRFFTEARAISAISDPGVVQIFDFGYHVDGSAYIVMELLEGESLCARLERLGRLPLVEALRLTRQLASSLYAAHERGIIHRDLKPGNVFVIHDSEAQGGERTKILDFGVCKLMSNDPDDASSTQTGTMLGTPVYMSPEQCRGTSKVDGRSDIYSLGCVMFHMLTGRPPFDCDNVGEFIASHLKDEADPPSTFAPELPPEVDALVMRCIAKRPEDRFNSMRDLQGAVEDLLASLSDPGRIVTPPVEHKETALGEGFRSEYDVNRNRDAGPPTVDARPPRQQESWFVDSQVPVPPRELPDDHAWVEPDRGMPLARRAALILIVFLVLVSGLALTGASVAGPEEADVPPRPMIAPTRDAVLAEKQTAFETVPPEPIAEQEDAASGDTTSRDDATSNDAATSDAASSDSTANDATSDDAAPASAKPERPAPVRKWHPQPRRHVPDSQDSQPQDDLYDTR